MFAEWRSKFYCTATSFLFFILSFVYWQYGFYHLPGVLLSAADTVAEFLDDGMDAVSEVSEAAGVWSRTEELSEALTASAPVGEAPKPSDPGILLLLLILLLLPATTTT